MEKILKKIFSMNKLSIDSLQIKFAATFLGTAIQHLHQLSSFPTDCKFLLLTGRYKLNPLIETLGYSRPVS